MKKMFKLFMCTAIVVASFTACSDTIDTGGGENGSDLEKATLTLTIGNAPESRAIVDDNATSNELKVSNAYIFVFNQNGSWAADTMVTIPGTFEDGDNKYKVTFHGAPVGDKIVYAGLNLDNTMRNKIRTNGVGTNGVWTYQLSGQNVFSPGNGGFPMFSEKAVAKTIVKGGPNIVDTYVKRFVAKTTIRTTADFVAGTNNAREASGATYSADLKFAIGQANTKIFPLPQANNVDPNWDGGAYLGDFENEFKGRGEAYPTDWDLTKYVDVDPFATDIADRTPKYFLENTHKSPRRGEITYVSIEAIFTPQRVATSFNEADKQPVTVEYTQAKAPATLYVVNADGSVYYYEDDTEAGKHIAFLNAGKQPTDPDYKAYKTYNDGKCFYDVYLDSKLDKSFQAERNDYYDVTVNNINVLGRPYPEIDPGTEEEIIGQTESITVNINVRKWTVVNMSDQILGDNM